MNNNATKSMFFAVKNVVLDSAYLLLAVTSFAGKGKKIYDKMHTLGETDEKGNIKKLKWIDLLI